VSYRGQARTFDSGHGGSFNACSIPSLPGSSLSLSGHEAKNTGRQLLGRNDALLVQSDGLVASLPEVEYTRTMRIVGESTRADIPEEGDGSRTISQTEELRGAECTPGSREQVGLAGVGN
jgi:hypothetical protein